MRALMVLLLVTIGGPVPALAQERGSPDPVTGTEPVPVVVPKAAAGATTGPAWTDPSAVVSQTAPDPVAAAPSDAAAVEPAPAPAPAPLPAPAGAPDKSERLWTCGTSLAGEPVEINYVRDEEFRQNVGALEKNLSGWGRISCPGYVTLREILRRNAMADDGSYCLLWDKANDTYIGARIGARKGNALCRRTFCERVNGARQAAFRNANELAIAGFDAVTQRPGAAILAAGSGQMVGTLETAGAVASGVAASPVAVGALVIGTAAAGGTMWYCAEE